MSGPARPLARSVARLSRRAAWLGVAAWSVSVLVAAGVAAVPPAGSRVLFRLQDPRIDEASGIAVGLASPAVVYVHNDSGDSARFFAVDARTGRTRVTYAVPGATNVDWEDIAVARDSRGVPSVWLADIGDNDGQRSEVDVYRVDEPHVSGLPEQTSTAPDVWRLRYPDGARDAESLAVDHSGQAYIFSKSLAGATRVYELPARPDADRVQELRRIGAITFHLTRPAGPVAALGQLTATGADISRDGALLAVRTYSDAYLWRIGSNGVAGAVKQRPVRVELPKQPQGEGIAFDGARLLVDSEQARSAVYAVPTAAAVTTPGSTAATPTPSLAPTRPVPVARSDRHGRPGSWELAAAAGLIGATATALWYARRRPRPRVPSARR